MRISTAAHRPAGLEAFICAKREKRLQLGGGHSAHGPDMSSSTRASGREKTCLMGCWRLSALGE